MLSFVWSGRLRRDKEQDGGGSRHRLSTGSTAAAQMYLSADFSPFSGSLRGCALLQLPFFQLFFAPRPTLPSLDLELAELGRSPSFLYAAGK